MVKHTLMIEFYIEKGWKCLSPVVFNKTIFTLQAVTYSHHLEKWKQLKSKQS